MNVVVNGRFLGRRVTGVERFGREILQRLGGRLRVARSERWVSGAAGYAWEQFSLPRQVRQQEVLWSPANLGPLAIRNQVLSLHDLCPLEHPGWFEPQFAWWYRLFVPLLARRVRYLTAPSEYIRAKALHRLRLAEEQVRVVPGGVDRRRFHPDAAPPGGLPERYVLFVGSLAVHKNLKTLLLAWRQVCAQLPDVWLLLAGGANPIFRRQALPADLERLRWLGYTSEAELPGLYAGAEVFVLPSLDEGFGLPILEAMASGTAVLAARAGALPAVAGGAAGLFDPGQTDELAQLLLRCLNEPAWRRSLAASGLARASCFSWEDAAERLWEVLQQCR